MAKGKIIRAQKGFQRRFVSSNVDVVIGGGAAGVGKTSAAVLSIARFVHNPLHRSLFLRKNLDELRSGGGMIDEFKNLYPKEIIRKINVSDSPEIELGAGARVTMTHINDERIASVANRFKGSQYDFIYMDEVNAFSFPTFTYLMTRNRGVSGEPALFRATTNPDPKSWLRKFLDWYIDENGFIDPQRDGVVRYFYCPTNSVEDVVWGDTAEQVYEICKDRIDRQMAKSGTEELGYRSFIKSFTFLSGRLGDNREMLSKNPSYGAALAMAGGAYADQLLEGNWNSSPEDEETRLISHSLSQTLAYNNPNINEKKYITADPAGEGEDNMIIMVWYGFHIVDWIAISKCTPVVAINNIRMMQEKHNIGDGNVIFDAIAIGDYLRSAFPTAMAFKGNKSPTPSGKHRYSDLKTQCADKFIEMFNERLISMDTKQAERQYYHQNIKGRVTFLDEFVKECSVLEMTVSDSNGKKKLLPKKEMNRKLGKGRSMDVVDNFIMRMYPDLNINVLANNTEIKSSTQNDRISKDEVTIDDFFNNW